MADGRISGGHARVAAQAVRDLPPEAADGLDQLVADQGARVDAGRLRTAVDDYAHDIAPESLVERERRAWESRRLAVSRTVEGGVALDGRLDVLGGETVLTALAALAAPGGADDDRLPEQRRADALVTLSRQALDRGELPVVGGVRPHVTVVVPLETLQTAGPDAAESGGKAETVATGRTGDTGGRAQLGLDATAASTGGTGGQAELGLDATAAEAGGAGRVGRVGGQIEDAPDPGATPAPGVAPGAGGGPARLDRLVGMTA